MTTDDLIDTAIDYLTENCELHAYERRGLYLHRDDATCSWWMIERDDLEILGRMLDDETPDAYSRWCSTTTGREVCCETIVREYDADENTDLDALQAEAGAADDMVSYMALRFLRDEVETIIEQDAEIAGEAA